MALRSFDRGVRRHGLPGVCLTCLERAWWRTVRAVEAVEWYYRDVEIVFTGREVFTSTF